MTIFLQRAGLALAMLLFAATAAVADSHVYKLYVDGLACPFCAYGVESIDIEIDDGVVLVTLADGATLDEATARRAVDQAGFTLREFVTPKAE